MAKGDIKRREVERLSACLPPISPAQELEARKCNGTAWLGKSTGWCDCCGKEFGHDLWTSRRKTMRCPVCGAELEVRKSPRKQKSDKTYYFQTMNVCDDWQVVRTYLCTRNATRRQTFGTEELVPAKVTFSITPVFEKWMKPAHIPVIIGLSVHGMSWYADVWNFFGEWKIRKDRYCYGVGGWVSRDAELLPYLKKRGLRRLSDGSNAVCQIDAVMHDWHAEVLLKSSWTAMFDYYLGGKGYDVRRYWDSVRIACRHGYRPRDLGMWFDYLHLLHNAHKDLRNPHYICPKSLKAAHDEYLRIEERRREKIRREEQAEAARRQAELLDADGKTNVEYMQRMGPYLGIVVRSGDIELKPLQNIRDFFDEGNALHHCVFECGYYKRKNSLIIGAKVKGERTETIEVNKSNWTISQCRGPHNGETKYHDRILKVMNDNMNKYRQAR